MQEEEQKEERDLLTNLVAFVASRKTDFLKNKTLTGLYFFIGEIKAFVMDKNGVIKKNRDFRRLYTKGKYLVSPNIITYVAKNRLNKTRVGITTSKKTGNAVMRNRARRVIRAAYFYLKPTTLKGFDIVFVSRQKTSEVKMQEVLKDMKYHFKKLGITKNSEGLEEQKN